MVDTGCLNTYWCHAGAYETLAVPKEGAAVCPWVNLYRCAVNVYYDVYNNGGCNLPLTHLRQQVEVIWRFRSVIAEHGARVAIGKAIKPLLRNRDYLPDSYDVMAMESVMDAIILTVAEFLRMEAE